MNKKIFFAFILTVGFTKPLSSQSWQMLKKIGIGNSFDQAEVLSSATDASGNTFLLGWYSGKIIFGDITFTGQYSSFTQYFLVKYDPLGNVQWAKSIAGSSSTISVSRVAVDNEGSVYVTGNMVNTSNFNSGSISFGSGASLTLPSSWDPYNYSGYIFKFSANGDLRLKKFYTGFDNNPVVVSADGMITLMGKLMDSYSPSKGPNEFAYFDSLTTYSTAGHKLWQKKVEYNFDMQLYSDGGSLWMTREVDSETIVFNGETYNVSNETLIMEYDLLTGNLLSVTPTNYQLKYLYPANIGIRNRHLYLFGSFWKANSSSLTFDNFTITSTKPTDFYFGHEGYLAKYDITNGEFDWAKHLPLVGGTAAMVIGPNERVYLNLGKDGINDPETISLFNSLGQPIWTLSSQAFIHDYVSFGLNNAEDVFVSGWASNGAGSSLTFGNLTFSYHNQVGFLSKIFNSSSVLSSLSVNSGTLTPAFQSALMQYSMQVEQSISTVTLTPTAFDPLAVIKINGSTVNSGQQSLPIILALGINVITVDVTATDGTTRSYLLTVIRGNLAPKLAEIGSVEGEEGKAITFQASATDPQADQLLTFALIDEPEGASINSNTGFFNWEPSETHGGQSFIFKVKVTDNGNPSMSDEKQITITVRETNKAPVVTTIENNDSFCGNNISFLITATDEDMPEQTLSFSLSGIVPEGATLNQATGLFSWTPIASQLGNHTITVRVTDDGDPVLFHEQSFMISVNTLESLSPAEPWVNSIEYNTTVQFTVNALPGVTNYEWNVPQGFFIESGQGTQTVLLRALNGVSAGNITVSAQGACTEMLSFSHSILASRTVAMVTVSDTVHVFTGDPKPVSISTEPVGLLTEVRYNGSLTVPSAVGRYNIDAFVIDDNYDGWGTAVLVIQIVTAVEDQADKHQVLPNPTSGRVEVDFGSYRVDFALTDMTGRTIVQGNARGSYSIDLKDNANGIYVLKWVQLDGKIIMRRIVKY